MTLVVRSEVSETSLYRFFDVDDRLLYVGITDVGSRRWRQHAGRTWWPDVAHTTVEHFADRAAAAFAEAEAIRSEHPLHNIVHAQLVRTSGPRRAYRSGTITRRTDGRWQVAFRTGDINYSTAMREEAEARLILAAFEYRLVRPEIRVRAIEILSAGDAWRPTPRRLRST